jgi:hypothetical protein
VVTVKAIVVVIAAVLAAGCGTASGSPPAAAPPPATCTLGAQGADVQVQITNSVPCGQDIQALAGDGQSWYLLSHLASPGSPGQADSETMYQVCQLHKDGSTMTVMDAGGAYWGGQICSGEEQGGWTP